MLGRSLVLTVILAVVSQGGAQSPKWSYAPTDYSQDPVVNGPLEWGSVSFDCDSGQQSPVDVQSNDATKQEYDTALTLEFSSDDSCNYGEGEICGTLINNGRSLIFQVNHDRTDLRLREGPLEDLSEYRLEKIKFHFGCEDEDGSEHAIDGKRKLAEMQIMFYKEEYGDYVSASSKPEGLAGIAVLLELNSRWPLGMDRAHVAFVLRLTDTNVTSDDITAFYCNKKGDQQDALSVFDTELQNVLTKGAKVEETQLPLFKLVPALINSLGQYFTYQGSMTIPPCHETVRWIVMKQPIKITEDQLYQLRTLQSTPAYADEPIPMCNNVRALQELNGREIDKNFQT